MAFNIASETVTKNATFEDATLRVDAAVRELVATQQTVWAKARGSSVLALMVADAYVAIRKIITNASAETQAAILSEHGVAAAERGTSQFTPWIKTHWGERHPDATVTFKDDEGETRVVWVPDRSMEIYHHTMEELMARGVETTDVKAIAETIMQSKGAATMAKDRKARFAKLAKEVTTPVVENTRKLFLENAKGPVMKLPLERPEKSGKFMTVLVRVIDNSADVEVLGVVDANAIKALDKMADQQAPKIKAQLAEKKTKASASSSARNSATSEGGLNSVRGMIAREKKARQTASETKVGTANKAA